MREALTKAEHDAIVAATGRPVTQGPRQRHRPAELMGGEVVHLPIVTIAPSTTRERARRARARRKDQQADD